MTFSKIKHKTLDFLFPLRKEVTRLQDELVELRSAIDVELEEVQRMYRSGEIVTDEGLQEALSEYCSLEDSTALRRDVDNKWDSYTGERYVDDVVQACACAEEVEGIGNTVSRLETEFDETTIVKTLVQVLLQNLTDEGECAVSHNGHKWVRS